MTKIKRYQLDIYSGIQRVRLNQIERDMEEEKERYGNICEENEKIRFVERNR